MDCSCKLTWSGDSLPRHADGPAIVEGARSGPEQLCPDRINLPAPVAARRKHRPPRTTSSPAYSAAFRRCYRCRVPLPCPVAAALVKTASIAGKPKFVQ